MTSHDEIKQLLVGIKSAQDSVSGRFDALESSLQGLKADWTKTNESVDELFRRDWRRKSNRRVFVHVFLYRDDSLSSRLRRNDRL